MLAIPPKVAVPMAVWQVEPELACPTPRRVVPRWSAYIRSLAGSYWIYAIILIGAAVPIIVKSAVARRGHLSDIVIGFVSSLLFVPLAYVAGFGSYKRARKRDRLLVACGAATRGVVVDVLKRTEGIEYRMGRSTQRSM